MSDPPPRARLIFTGAAGGLALLSWGAHQLEPLSPWACDEVYMAGVHTEAGSKGQEHTYFNLSSTSSLNKQYHVPYISDLPENYFGPAALWTSVGKWTGMQRYRLTGRCIDLPLN